MSSNLQTEIIETEDQILDAIDDVIRFWGFKGMHGRVWGLLFLSPDALTMNQIRQRLDLSVGSVSMALKELRDMGVVTRLRKKKNGQTQYTAETDFRKMIARILDYREKRLIDDATSDIRNGVKRLNMLQEEVQGEQQRDIKYKAGQARQLESLGGNVSVFIESLIQLSKVDASLKKIAKLPSRIAQTLQ